MRVLILGVSSFEVMFCQHCSLDIPFRENKYRTRKYTDFEPVLVDCLTYITTSPF